MNFKYNKLNFDIELNSHMLCKKHNAVWRLIQETKVYCNKLLAISATSFIADNVNFVFTSYKFCGLDFHQKTPLSVKSSFQSKMSIFKSHNTTKN